MFSTHFPPSSPLSTTQHRPGQSSSGSTWNFPLISHLSLPSLHIITSLSIPTLPTLKKLEDPLPIKKTSIPHLLFPNSETFLCFIGFLDLQTEREKKRDGESHRETEDSAPASSPFFFFFQFHLWSLCEFRLWSQDLCFRSDSFERLCLIRAFESLILSFC